MNSPTTCAAQGGVWRPGKAAPSQVVFRSVDEGRSWKYQGVIADPAEYADPHSSLFSVVGSTSELAIAQLADGRTLTARFAARRLANLTGIAVADGEPCSTAFAMRVTASKKAAPKTEAKV